MMPALLAALAAQLPARMARTPTLVPPLVERAAFPYSDALALALDRDGGVAFVAEGASIAIVDVDPLPACVVARVPIDACPAALLADGAQLFVAGGTRGLSTLATCAQLGAGCTGCATYTRRLVDDAGESACVDVARISGHPQGELVAALYAARGASELRIYDRAAPHSLRSVCSLAVDSTSIAAALATDPLDPFHVYVSLGAAGLGRVDLSNLASPTLAAGPRFDDPAELVYGESAVARDLALVRAGGATWLYAALERAGLAEMRLPADPSQWGPSSCTWRGAPSGCAGNPTSYAYRVAALADGTGRVLVALATHPKPAREAEGGPYSPLGTWDFRLGLGNVPAPAPSGCEPRLVLFARDANGCAPTSGACATPLLGPCEIASVDVQVAWRGLALKRSGAHWRLFAQHWNGLSLVDLGVDPFATPTFATLASYAGRGVAAIDGAISTVDPAITYVGTDAAGAPQAGLLALSDDDASFAIVPDTDGLCSAPSIDFCDGGSTPRAPDPWSNGLFGAAHWVDAFDPTREWFVAGKGTLFEQCPSDPCSWSDAWCTPIWRRPPPLPVPGWQIASFAPGAQPRDAAHMELRWWQLASPPDAHGRRGRNYMASEIDERPDRRLLHLFRGGLKHGYVVCDASEVEHAARTACASGNGRGQWIAPTWMHALPTHFEYADSEPQSAALTWRGDVFELQVGAQRRRVLALACGYVSNQSASGAWTAFADRALVVLYDVTDVGPTQPPTLLRLALSAPGTHDNAIAARAATLGGRTWLFVAGLAGSLDVFDVSADVLYPGVPAPTDPSTALSPVGSGWRAPPSAYDGFPDNIVDLELDGSRAYLAHTRRGVSVIEVSSPLAPREVRGSPIDTPGLAEGITVRRVGGHTTLLVGDARGGVRLFQPR